jgi:hypothetical protein
MELLRNPDFRNRWHSIADFYGSEDVTFSIRSSNRPEEFRQMTILGL